MLDPGDENLFRVVSLLSLNFGIFTNVGAFSLQFSALLNNALFLKMR